MSSLTYRPEVDGLRALAVISVIFFHAGFEWLGGGYLGVDIFFVISGFLITQIILNEKDTDTFCLWRFWERRARRILPALFLMVLICIPLAWIFLLPKEHWEFKESVGSVALFLSNHLFLDQSGYFDTAAERKPLLHTWSLAVEEQFYLLFPVLLIGIYRFGLSFLVLIISVIVILSFGLSEWLSQTKPAVGFYILFTRAWELGFGVLLAIIDRKKPSLFQCEMVQKLLAFIGLGLLVLSFLIYTPETRTPSIYTLVPVIGTGFIILGANQNNMVGRFLGLRTPVGIGLISYSLYLWHQPIFAFARVQTPEDLSLLSKCLLIIFAFLLAYGSWKWIETPFRNKNKIPTKTLVLFALPLSLFFVLTGIDGYREKQANRKSERTNMIAPISQPSIMLLGDSHASHLLPGLNVIFPGQVADFSRAGCLPFYGVDRYDSRGRPGVCPSVMATALDHFQKEDTLKTLILSSMGPVYLTGEAFRGKDLARVKGMQLTYEPRPDLKDRWMIYELALRDTLSKLSSSGKQIIFLIDVPELGVDPLFCDTEGKTVGLLALEIKIREPDNKRCHVSRSDYNSRTERYRNLVKRVIADYPEIKIFDPTDLFCDDVICIGILNNKPLYKDADHLSRFGSEYVAQNLSKLVGP